MTNGIYLDELFIDSHIAAIKPSGCKEYIGTTLSMINNESTLTDLARCSSDNFNHARAIVNDKFVYFYNGEQLDIKY